MYERRGHSERHNYNMYERRGHSERHNYKHFRNREFNGGGSQSQNIVLMNDESKKTTINPGVQSYKGKCQFPRTESEL